MVRVLGPTEYKVVARPRPKAGSPLIVIPTTPSVPSCSKLSRYGLAKGERVERLVRRPTLTAPARDGLGAAAGRDEETGFQIEQRNPSKKASKKERREIAAALKPLDKAHTRVTPWF